MTQLSMIDLEFCDRIEPDYRLSGGVTGSATGTAVGLIAPIPILGVTVVAAGATVRASISLPPTVGSVNATQVSAVLVPAVL